LGALVAFVISCLIVMVVCAILGIFFGIISTYIGIVSANDFLIIDGMELLSVVGMPCMVAFGVSVYLELRYTGTSERWKVWLEVLASFNFNHDEAYDYFINHSSSSLYEYVPAEVRYFTDYDDKGNEFTNSQIIKYSHNRDFKYEEFRFESQSESEWERITTYPYIKYFLRKKLKIKVTTPKQRTINQSNKTARVRAAKATTQYGIVKTFIYAIKNKVCPTVKFID
jgi:hypothetical protein